MRRSTRQRRRSLRGLSFGALTAVAASLTMIAACDDPTPPGLQTLTVDAEVTSLVEAGRAPDSSITIDPSISAPFGSSIDLGAADCGGHATKTVAFNNAGGTTLDIALATTAPFTISPPTLVVPPGGNGTVTIAVDVPASSVAGTPLTSTIIITANDPKNPKVTVPVSITPTGATLIVTKSAAIADFGTQKLGVKSAPLTLDLANTGNKAATFTFATPTDTQFSIAPTAPITLDPLGGLQAFLSFTPDKLSLSTSSSNVVATGAICGASLTKIDMAGQGAVGNVTGWPSTTLDFGKSSCGGAKAASKNFTLTNTGASDVTITAVNAGTKGYAANVAANAKVPKNGGTLVFTVTPPAVPFPSPVPGNYADTLTVTTDTPDDPPHVINLNVAASGAILAFDTSTTPNFGAFGGVPAGTTATQTFAVKNTGNLAASVIANAGTSSFGVSNAAAFNVPANGATSLNATFHPISTGPQTGSLSIDATGLCQPLPSAKSLSGTGTVGGIVLSDTSLSFSANCGTTAAAKTFTITNTGTAPMTWTGTMNSAKGTYSFSPLGATVAPNAVSTVTVTPAAIPQYPASITPSAFSDFITIKSDIPGATDRLVFLNETPLGAVLSFSNPSLGFGSISINTTSTLPLSILNNGNPGQASAVTVASNNTPKFVVNSASGNVNPGNSFPTSVTFKAGATAGTFNGLISVSATAICAPLPTAIATTGTAALANVVISPSQSTISFGASGLTPCGTTASIKDLQFTNPPPGGGGPSVDYTVTSTVLGKGAASPFTVATLGGGGPGQNVVLQNNGNVVTVRITPNAIPPNVASVPSTSTFSDTLTITTDAAQDSPHVFQLSQGAKGVILDPIATTNWAFGTVPFGSMRFFTQSLHNAGNEDVQVSMAGLAATPQFAFAPTTIPSGSTIGITASFQPSDDHSSWTGNGTLSVPAGTTWCQSPVPSFPITLTGSGSNGALYTIDETLTFPSVTCGAAANPSQTVTLKNDSAVAINYSATLATGTWYSLASSPLTGSVPALSTTTLTVSPKPLVSGTALFSGTITDQLNVALTNAGGGALTTLSVAISQFALGADLNVDDSDDLADDSAEWGSCDYSGFITNGYYAKSASYKFTNSGTAQGFASSTFNVPNDGWIASPEIALPMGATTSLVSRYGGTSPPNTCGVVSNTATLALRNICHNPLASLNFTVRRMLNNCAYAVPAVCP